MRISDLSSDVCSSVLVGSYLAVHEGPQRIAKPAGGQAGTEEPLHAGMILSNEPGYYKAGHFGIRIENLVIVVPQAIADAEEDMLGFETITFEPIARDLVDVRSEERRVGKECVCTCKSRGGP